MRSYNFPGVYVPNIRHADLCVSVAELGSLTAAAERKNISQPAASQAIAGLEVQFGGQIFERTNGKLSLTPRGEVVHLRFVRGLKLLALCDEIVSIPMLGQKRSLNVAIAFSIAAFALSGSQN